MNWTERKRLYSETAFRQVPCRKCGAIPGHPCKSRRGNPVNSHAQRWREAHRRIEAKRPLSEKDTPHSGFCPGCPECWPEGFTK